MNAFDNLNLDGPITAVVFGEWGWGSEESTLPNPVPEHARGQILEESEAREYGEGWSFYGGYGSPDCYATYIYTAKTVYFVVQYDGSTRLVGVPRSPEPGLPKMPGG